MEYKIIPWSAVYSHIPQKSVIENVATQHLNQFPEKFFKNRWLNDKRSIQDMFRDSRFLSETSLPSVSVSYEIDDDPKNTLESADYPYNYPSHFIAGRMGDYYWRVYNNPTNKTEIYMSSIRKKITLTFKYRFADVYTRDDMYTWMLNTFRYAGPPATYGLHNVIQVALPNNMLEYLASAQRCNLKDKESLDNYNMQLFKYSKGLFRKKKVTMKETTHMWFLDYQLPHMQLIQASKPEKVDGEQKGQIMTNYGIDEVLEFEPYLPQSFFTRMPSVVNGQRIPDEYKPANILNLGYDNRLLRTRNYTIDPVSRDAGLKLDRFDIISNIEFCEDVTGSDILDIDGEIYGQMHLNIIDKLLKRGEDVDNFYQIYIYAFDTKLKQDVDYSVDWRHKKINLFHVNETTNYRLVGAARRDALKPYIQNELIHTDEYDKVFPVPRYVLIPDPDAIPNSIGMKTDQSYDNIGD